jgi:hypothetical protein
MTESWVSERSEESNGVAMTRCGDVTNKKGALACALG